MGDCSTMAAASNTSPVDLNEVFVVYTVLSALLGNNMEMGDCSTWRQPPTPRPWI
jgi:hypothetical protein